MGSSFLRKLTLVKQTGYGTSTTDLSAAVTGVIPTGFKGDWHDMSEFQNPGDAEYNGIMVPVNRLIKISDMAEVTFDGDLTFQNVDYLLNAGWQQTLASSTVGTTGKQRVYSDYGGGTLTSSNWQTSGNPLFSTVIAGDNSVNSGSGYAILDAFITQWSVGAARGGYTTASGTYSGHTLSTLTTPQYTNITASRLSGTSIPAWAWKLYIDDAGGTIGATQKAGTLIDWSIKGNPSFHHKKFLDGQISPTSYGQGRTEVTLDMTFEQNSTALAELVKFETNAPRLIRLQALGAVIGAGTAVNTITFDLVGNYTAFDKPGDSDGNTTIKASFKCMQVIGTGYFGATTINSVATLV